MPTNNKGLEQPANGSNVDTWDVPVNGNFGIIDKAFGGVYSLNLTGVTTPVAVSASDAQNLIFNITGTMTANATLRLPLNSSATAIVGGQWIIRNAATGSSGGVPYTVTISPVSGGGTSVIVPQGSIVTIYCDGTNIRTTDSTADRFPVGGIVMWSGTIATIPPGWFLCDGSNGTPNLRDKFIIGASQDEDNVAKTNITGSLTQTGGSKDATLVSHTHTATVTDPGHGHAFRYANGTAASANQLPTGGFVLNQINLATQNAQTTAPSDTNQIGGNTTGITVANSTEGASGTNANLVPYYALAYIMRGAY